MAQRIKLSLIYDDGVEYSSQLTMPDHIDLREETWAWLKDAFVGIGFDQNTVDKFFNLSTDES